MANDSPDWSGKVQVISGLLDSIVQNAAIRTNGVIDLGEDSFDGISIPVGDTIVWLFNGLQHDPPIMVERILLVEHFQHSQLEDLEWDSLHVYTSVLGTLAPDPYSSYHILGTGANMAADNWHDHHFFISEWRFVDSSQNTTSHMFGNVFALQEKNNGSNTIPAQIIKAHAFAITENNIFHGRVQI
jgi:hypothetical protein